MEKLFQTHKELVVTVIVILSILLCANFYSDATFKLVDLAIIAFIAAGIAFLVGMVSGYSYSKNGAHGTEETAGTTTNVIGAFGLAFGIMLAANFFDGHASLFKTECCMVGIAAIIILVMLSPLGGPGSHKAGNRHDRTVIGEHGGTRTELEVDTAEATDNKSSKGLWAAVIIGFLFFCFVFSRNNNESPVTMLPANSSTTTSPVVTTTTTTTVTTPEKEAGYE